MENILRSFGAVIDDVDSGERSVVAKISTGELDRYHTVIKSNGVDFANYRKNPVVLFEHGKSPVRGTLPIGRNLWVKPDGVGNGRILAKTIFAKDEFSDLLFSFYKDGTMRGWSISILPEDVGPPSRDEVRSRPELKECELVYRTSEMLEYSAVGIPGAADCLSDPELRSLSTLVMRGFWTPTEDVKPLVEPIVERMCESGGMAEGGALVDDDETPKKKKKRSTDDDEDEDGEEAERSMADEGGDAAEPESETVETTVERDAEEVTADPPVEAIQRDHAYYWNVFHYALSVRGMKPEEFGALTIEQVDLLDAERREFAAKPVIDEPVVETPVDPLAGLPPLIARRFDDVLNDRMKMVDKWNRSTDRIIEDLSDWLLGKA